MFLSEKALLNVSPLWSLPAKFWPPCVSFNLQRFISVDELSVIHRLCIQRHLFILFYFIFVLGLHPWHIKVPRLGVESELQLLAYTTATAMPDPHCIWDLHHSSQQHQFLNPLSEARDRTRILMDTSRVLNLLSYNRNSLNIIYKNII